MKRLLRLSLILALCIVPIKEAQAADDIAEELFETKFSDEVLLNTQSQNNKNDIALNSQQNQVFSTFEKNTERLKQERNIKKLLSENNTSTDSNTNDAYEEENDNNGVLDNTELDFEIFKMFDQDKDDDGKIDETSLFGKITHSKIKRTDVPSFLFKDDLTFKYEKGPISKIQTYGAYRGSISSFWQPNNYTTEYDNLTTQLGMYGQFRNPDFKFKLAINPIPMSGTNYIDRFINDAYIVNTSLKNHQIVTGYSRVQTGIEGGTSSLILPFVARSQIARNFGSAKSLSVKLIGNYQYADYNFAFGSSGRYVTSGMPGTEFNGWVNLKPLGNKSKKYGKLTIGGGLNAGHHGSNYSVLSGYVGYHHKKLWANFETAIADGYNGSKGPSENKACGYAATVGWKFTPQVQLIGRIDQFDPNRDISHNLQREYTVGLNWFIKGQALKVILNYVYCDNQNRPDSHKLILATQVLI